MLDRHPRTSQYPPPPVSLIQCTSAVDAASPPNECHSSDTLSNVTLQCITAANKVRTDLCSYKITSGGNHHLGNKLMLIWSRGPSGQMPGEFHLFIYIYIFLFSYQRLCSGAIDLGAEPFVLWSNKAAYWFIGGRQLPFASSSSSSSCSRFRSTAGSPGRKSFVCMEAEA